MAGAVLAAWCSPTGPGRSTRRSPPSRRASTATASRSSRCAGSSSLAVPVALGLFAGSAASQAVADVPAVVERGAVRHARTRSSTWTSASSSSPCRGCSSSPGSSPRWSSSPRWPASSRTTSTAGCGCRARGPRLTSAARIHLVVLAAAFLVPARRRLLARPLRPDHQGLRADHRPELHRRARRAHARGRARRDRRHRRRALRRRRARRAAGGSLPLYGVVACWSSRDPHRRHLPGDRPALPGAAERADPGGALHPAQHRGDPGRLRPRPGHAGRRTAARRRRRRAATCAQDAADPGHPADRPDIVSDAFRQLQQTGQYYTLPGQPGRRPLHDRRQRSGTPSSPSASSTWTACGHDQRNWVNDHIVYTHGFGVVAAYGNQRTDRTATPVFFQEGIPSSGSARHYQPRVYFGEKSPDYSIVGAPAGRRRSVSSTTRTTSATGQQNMHLHGQGRRPDRVDRSTGCCTR